MGLVGSLNRGAVQGGFPRVSVLVLVGLQMMSLPLALLINRVEGLPMQLALVVLLLSGGVVRYLRKGLVPRGWLRSGDLIWGWEVVEEMICGWEVVEDLIMGWVR